MTLFIIARHLGLCSFSRSRDDHVDQKNGEKKLSISCVVGSSPQLTLLFIGLLGVWPSGGSDDQKHKRETRRYILVWPIEALHPTLVVFLYSRALKSGVTTKQRERVGKESLNAILWLADGEVDALASKENTPRSCWFAPGRSSLLLLSNKGRRIEL